MTEPRFLFWVLLYYWNCTLQVQLSTFNILILSDWLPGHNISILRCINVPVSVYLRTFYGSHYDPVPLKNQFDIFHDFDLFIDRKSYTIQSHSERDLADTFLCPDPKIFENTSFWNRITLYRGGKNDYWNSRKRLTVKSSLFILGCFYPMSYSSSVEWLGLYTPGGSD